MKSHSLNKSQGVEVATSEASPKLIKISKAQLRTYKI